MNLSNDILHAVLLAGGKSTRMGHDKCLLDWYGAPLWQHQLATLKALKPSQIHVASPSRPGWLPEGIHWCKDSLENAGPISGLHAALVAAHPAMLAVLAIDLPNMTTEYLQELITQCDERAGCVPHSQDGFEPLAAIYPSMLAESADAWMKQGNRQFQGWLTQLCEQGSMRSLPVTTEQSSLFLNLNHPSDLMPS